MKIKSFVLFFLIVLALFVMQGCGKKVCELSADCDDKNSCTKDVCFEGKECRHNQIKNCHCGDTVCDKERGENECSCPNDCNKCAGKVGKYLQKLCVEGSCVISVDSKNITEKSFSDIISDGELKMKATYSYDLPYDIKRSVFRVTIEPYSLGKYISRPRINKIELYEKLDKTGKEISMLGSKSVDKILWSEDTIIDDEIILDEIIMNGSETAKKVNVAIYYEYLSGEKNDLKSKTYSKELKDAIVFVEPGTEMKCPDSCNDENLCTKDYCSEKTGHFCIHEKTTAACCGNNICDPDENSCKCPADCGSCRGTFGEYMEFNCINEGCSATIRDNVVVKPITLVDTKALNGFSIETKIKFNEPFSMNDDSILISVAMTNLQTGIKDVKFNRVQLLSKGELLAEKAGLEKGLSQIGQSFETALPLTFTMTAVEEEYSPTLRFFYEYTKLDGSHLSNQQYEKQISNLVVINPS
jgi:hypothetical protein